jgi:SAM-dependent methyltransferase
VYRQGDYHAEIWELQRPYLVGTISKRFPYLPVKKYLDFACGTGRIFMALQPLAAQSTGLDLSPAMVTSACGRAPGTDIRQGNLLAEPEVVDSDYDLITAFRFFLNTDPNLRQRILSALAQRLRGPDSRLIFNAHGIWHSAYGVGLVADLVRRRPLRAALSVGQVRRLLYAAGLELIEWRGFGLMPGGLYRTPLGGVARTIDRAATRHRQLDWVSRDVVFVCGLRR